MRCEFDLDKNIIKNKEFPNLQLKTHNFIRAHSPRPLFSISIYVHTSLPTTIIMEQDTTALQSPLDPGDPIIVQCQIEETDFSKAIEERIILLSDPRFSGSGLLRRVHQILLEAQARAQRPAL
jgi:hypothetical protein